MHRLVLRQPGQLVSDTTAEPGPPEAGEVLLRIRRVGVCGTDYHAYRGRQPFFEYPRVLGHELGAEVVALGDGVTTATVGDRVAVEPYLNCGTCQPCRVGFTNCCEHLRVLGVHTDGGLTEYLRVPANKVHIANALSFDQLALVETLGIGAHAVSRAAVRAGDLVLVVGAGPIGLGVVQFAKAAGATVVVLDFSEPRLRFCRERLGADAVLVPNGDETLPSLRQLLGGDLPTAVFDATGNATSMHEAFRYPAPGGRLTFVGLFPGDVTFHDPDFHRRELTLLASRNALPADFRRILGLMETGALDTTPWITDRAPLADAPAAIEAWLQPGQQPVKAVIDVA
jgi:2-desacetyl-2-hydroxyethyl bacteriochlorophyllide A dehydrogenase